MKVQVWDSAVGAVEVLISGPSGVGDVGFRVRATRFRVYSWVPRQILSSYLTGDCIGATI